MMRNLCITRKPREGVVLFVGEETVRVEFVRYGAGKARLCVQARPAVKILRDELVTVTMFAGGPAHGCPANRAG